MKKVRLLLAALGLTSLLLVPAAPASATNVFEDICDQDAAARSAACEARGDDPLTGPDGIIARITNIVAVIAGILAVIIILWGGFTYMTSAGDANKTTNARNTIIYAAIGLVVIVLAQTIVMFVLSNIL